MASRLSKVLYPRSTLCRRPFRLSIVSLVYRPFHDVAGVPIPPARILAHANLHAGLWLALHLFISRPNSSTGFSADNGQRYTASVGRSNPKTLRRSRDQRYLFRDLSQKACMT